MSKRVVLVSRELFPFASGGIGEYVWSIARLLSDVADVTILTSDRHADEHRRLSERSDPRLPDARVEFVHDVEAHEVGSFYGLLHRYSARVHERLVELFPDGGPDLVEFSDYLGEGFVTVQARKTRDPRLRNTRVAVRLHTTAEMCLVLDRELPIDDPELETTFEMERYTLAHADHLLWPGGGVLSSYERFYGRGNLAPQRCVPNPFVPIPTDAASVSGDDVESTPEDEIAPDDILRFLYLGRLERRKGVQTLVSAMRGLHGDWRLTLLGGDTPTAPLGRSMRRQLELTAAGEGRISFLDAMPRDRLPALIRAHDVVVLPSRWECWPYVALEAMRQNRPVVATPTGGYTAIVEPETSGWLTGDTTEGALRRTLGRLVDDPNQVRATIVRRGPRQRFERLTDRTEIVEAYRRLLDEPARAMPRRSVARPPLVSVVVPYFRLDRFVERTVASACEQTYPRVEVLVVNDGSFRDRDRVLAEVCSRWPVTVLHQANAGLGAARNFGIAQSRGRYVLPLDADDEIEPELVERAVDVLEHDRSIAYVGCWSRFVDEHGDALADTTAGYEPFGNWTRLAQGQNYAGSCTALIRRHLFDRGCRYSEELASFEDWTFYLELAQAGLYGHVIPERLLRYRTRERSMLRAVGAPRVERLRSEMKALLAERRIRWTS